VEVRTSLTIDGKYTADDKSGSNAAMFFKIYLVR
jgi:hypothetical protein